MLSVLTEDEVAGRYHRRVVDNLQRSLDELDDVVVV